MALKLDAIGKPLGPLVKEYDWKDVVLYALGVGAGFDDLEYCYENQLKVVPSFSIGAVFDFLAATALSSEADLTGILHGEQDIIFHDPIPTEGTLTTEGRITQMYDKGAGKGALVVAEADTVHSNGRKLFTNLFTLFSRKDGGFGGEDAPPDVVEFPDREPDFVEDAHPSADQPLMYRLSGDVFALHVDPQFARATGFEKPIMHGLCTHGYACRAVVKHLFPGEPERIGRFKVRFSRTLYPGVPISTQIWKTGDGEAVFRTVNLETGEVVIDRGVVEWLTDEQLAQRERQQGIRFDDRVAVVTGAGGGLGRIYALELAKRGAKVVVNDLGGTPDGAGETSGRPADEVVAEIEALGGEAVASYDSVSTEDGGKAIVQRAVEAFGRIDILINNAGILRDKSLVKMQPADWEAVHNVHLDGVYFVTRPAFQLMKAQGYGRIVMTTSAAGLYGNFGQTNYSAAKMGQVGFASTLKLEGRKYDVKVNTVAPIALTRLTEDILPPNLAELLQPEYVAPLVLFLCSEDCPESGGIYNAGAGYFNRAAVVCGDGVALGDGDVATPEEFVAAWDDVASIDGAEEYLDAMATFGPMMAALEGKPAPRKKKPKAPSKEEAPPEKPAGVTPAAVFERMPDAFAADRAAGVDVVFQYKLSGDGGGEWYTTIADGACTVDEGVHDKPTTTILMSAEDFVALIKGELNAMNAFTTGKLQIEGDLMKSQLIEKLFRF